MQIITTREIRANQNKYFDLAEKEPVFVARKNARLIVIKVADEEDFVNKEDLLAIQKGLENIKNCTTTNIKDINNIWDSIL